MISLRKDLHIFTSSLYQTNTAVIETPGAIFLIDPCWLPKEVEAIRQFVNGRIGKKYLYLIFTHSDYDHIIGYGAFPNARVIASRAFDQKADKQRDVDDAVKWDRQNQITRTYPLEYPSVHRVIDLDGKALHYSGTVMTFYLAPGHTAEGLMVVWEPAGVLVAGDYLSNIEFPFVEDSILAYRRTMAKVDRILRSHQINWMIPGHGSIAHGRDEVIMRKEEAIEYLDDLQSAKDGIAFPEEKYRRRYPDWDELKPIHQKQLMSAKP